MARILTILSAASMVAAVSAGQVMAQSADAGAKVFKAQCSVCHQAAKNAPPSVGPNLFGVAGSRAGAAPGYRYSDAMKRSGLSWTPDALKRYLTNPQAAVPGNKMPYAGLKDAAKLSDLIAYLGMLK